MPRRDGWATNSPPMTLKGLKNCGTVLIRFIGPDHKPRTKRVSIRLAFDPLAISMTPIPGWTAAGAASALDAAA